tara:strand:+ start:1083 stop:1184 length:102 start_codon:yes stop_codon:yes gene_type:complete
VERKVPLLISVNTKKENKKRRFVKTNLFGANSP